MATLAGMRAAAAPILALDTSTQEMSVALRGPLGVRLHKGEAGAQASATLLPQIQAMLREQGLRVADLQAVAFGCGPGAFTGLRTACAVAQGLSLGAGCLVLPVDSLMLVAEETAGPVLPPAALAAIAMDARMGEVYAGLYRWCGQDAPAGWEVVQPPCLCGPADLPGRWRSAWRAHPGTHWVAGSGLALLPPGTVPAGMPARAGGQRAAALLRLAERLLAAGSGIDPAQALPLYLRDKVALTVAERAAAPSPAA